MSFNLSLTSGNTFATLSRFLSDIASASSAEQPWPLLLWLLLLPGAGCGAGAGCGDCADEHSPLPDGKDDGGGVDVAMGSSGSWGGTVGSTESPTTMKNRK